MEKRVKKKLSFHLSGSFCRNHAFVLKKLSFDLSGSFCRNHAFVLKKISFHLSGSFYRNHAFVKKENICLFIYLEILIEIMQFCMHNKRI